MFVARRPFRNGETMVNAGSVVEPADIIRFKRQLHMGHIIEITDEQVPEWEEFFRVRYGVEMIPVELGDVAARVAARTEPEEEVTDEGTDETDEGSDETTDEGTDETDEGSDETTDETTTEEPAETDESAVAEDEPVEPQDENAATDE